MRGSSAKLVLYATLICACVTEAARADVLLDQTALIGLPGVAAPVEYAFTESTAQALTLTLTDLQEPAAFGSLEVAVTLNDALVGTATIDSTTHTGTFSIPAAAGNYLLHVIGTPNTDQGIGSFGVCVAPSASAASCSVYQNSGNITTPATTSSTGTSTLNTNFTSTAAGTYTVTLTDDAFPVALQSLSAGVFNGSTPIAVNIPSGASTPVTLAAKTPYILLVAAQANSATEAGLYGIRITDPSGAVIFDRTLPVGTLPGSTIVDSTAARDLSVTLSDYQYPAALASVGVAVTQGSTALTALTAAGSATNFMAAAGNVEVWQYAVAGSQPGTYSLQLSVYQSNPTDYLFSINQVVNVAPISSASDFAFIANLPAAGTYSLAVNDFGFPGALTSISSSVAQNGVLLPLSSGDFTGVEGPAVVLVNATAPASGLGIFGVTVQATGATPQVVLDQTQAVGGIFDTQVITLAASGSYNVTLADLGFPQAFSTLSAVVSQDSEVLGKIYGGGTFQFNGTPGQYVVTLVAIPNSTTVAPPSLQNYGLYSLHVASAPPTVTLTSSAASVTAGGMVTLTWSSTDATACVASGGAGWTGSQANSGTLGITVSATETLALSCTGPGGSAAQSVTVTATPAPAKSGGGAIDLVSIIALMSVWAAAWRRRYE
jgi:hypothetical protein